MKIPESCARCLYDKQAHKVHDVQYLKRVKEIIENRRPEDTSPYMIYLFDNLHKEMFGCTSSYQPIKKQFNDLVLNMEGSLRNRIKQAKDPLLKAFQYARIGNYIDFGAMNHVNTCQFMDLLECTDFSERDFETYHSFLRQCGTAEQFLLICDNCGEIVLDKLFLEQLTERFPGLHIHVLVRGEEIINDATEADARYVGIDQLAEILTNGHGIAGTIYHMLPEQTKHCIDSADVILAKGQGNYESLSGSSLHIFYSFLCKCELFMERFDVPQFTGIFVEEKPQTPGV